MDIERLLVLEVARVTEQAALAASRLAGMGKKDEVDGVGTEAMRQVLGELPISGTVVIGEGEMDEAPMLYIGERLGQGGPEVDIAVDPVEGTNITAKGLPNAITVIAISEQGGLFHAPDMYMQKLVVGPPAAGKVSLNFPVEANLRIIADSLERKVDDLVVVILDRPRHEKLIKEVRQAGARVKLITDGDVVAAVAVAIRGTGAHAMMGSGGAPEGVLAAAALKCMGGEIQGRFLPEDDAQKERLVAMGGSADKIYKTHELAPGKQMVFAATGITHGELLEGVRYFGGGARTHSIVMGHSTQVVRFIDSIHLFEKGARVNIRV
ncbi:MAG: class II fructose-bisphosphatase [Meiothermus sp.]|nr:class II fructose-bisphosphatase [Meiothermus sp.]